MRALCRLFTQCTLLALLSVHVAAAAQTLLPPPPNMIPITPMLTTSGQPSAAWLETLGSRGVEAVIYLAPLTVGDAVPDEPQILARQSIAFVHIPIAFNQPGDADFQRFVVAMNEFAGKNILVHCQINMRASSMVFLYRTIVGKENPNKAFEAVERVWVPNGVWQRFTASELKANGIAFELTSGF